MIDPSKIKRGDRLRWKLATDWAKAEGRDVITIGAIDREDGVVWSQEGMVWISVFSRPDEFELITDKPVEQADLVNHPPHYTKGEIECIDAIRAALGKDGFRAYCRGNAIKYAWRCDHKGGSEDLKKAAWYLNWATQEKSK